MKTIFQSVIMVFFCLFLISSCKKNDDTLEPVQASQPKDPYPADSAINISTSPVLRWTYPDAAGGSDLVYDLRFGTSNPPNYVTYALKYPNFQLVGLEKNSTYYWSVTARTESWSYFVNGPVWRFKTNDSNVRNFLFQDDFENYQPNTFPASGGWIANAVASDYRVSDSVFHSSHQSFKITGNKDYPDCYHRIPVFPIVTYLEAWIKTPSDIIPSDGGLFCIAIRDYFAITFNCGQQTINYDVGDYWGGVSIELQKFLPDLWYKINLKFDKVDMKITCSINDIQKYQSNLLPDNPPAVFDFCCYSKNLNKDVYLDDLKIWYE